MQGEEEREKVCVNNGQLHLQWPATLANATTGGARKLLGPIWKRGRGNKIDNCWSLNIWVYFTRMKILPLKYRKTPTISV